MLALLFQDDIEAQAGSNVGGSTEIHPVGVAALGLLMGLVLLVPRRWAALPVIALLCFIPASQRVVIASVDFTFIRLLMAVVWVRLYIRGDLRPIVWNHLDRAMILWAFVSIFTGFLLGWTLSIVVNRIGVMGDAMMVYFFFRMLIRNHHDLIAIATQFILCSLAVSVFFVIENRTQRNMFAMFGGVPEFTDIRDGRLRCQGAFAHAILAGCFWACLIPYYAIRHFMGHGRWLTSAGVAAAFLILIMCSSSTPIMAVLFGIMAGGMFLVRGSMRWIRWLVIGWLMVLHFVLMKQPVWHLLARANVIGGSTGWHRFHLVDKFFAFFHEWWQCGTLRTGHWGPGLHDVTNQFVAEGVGGGIWRLACFVICVFLAFSGVSRSMRLPEAPKAYYFASWALGVALFMHCMNFIAVTYFEQIVVEWHMALAAIGSLTLVPGAPVERQLAQLAGD